jgi:hypothetical protein
MKILSEMKTHPYASPAVFTRYLELENWVAGSPKMSGAIKNNSLNAWGVEDTLGDALNNDEGGDARFTW